MDDDTTPKGSVQQDLGTVLPMMIEELEKIALILKES